MLLTRRWRSAFVALLLFLVLGAGVYHWAFGSTIQADELRHYRFLPSGKLSPRAITRRQGDAAQRAADNFRFSSTGVYEECLNADGWVRIVFNSKQKNQVFDVYLPNGQIQPNRSNSASTAHLSQDSRIFWEQLVNWLKARSPTKS